MTDITVTYENTNIVGRGLGLAFASEADTTYAYFKKLAEEFVANDLPEGISTSMAAHCTMLMICHMYMGGDPETGMRSFNSGDFSGSQDPGVTTYYLEYQRTIDRFQQDSSKAGAENVTRADASMGDFKLDQNKLPAYFRET
jgi:hypothetical protein